VLVWGFSLGASIALQLGARSARVDAVVCGGAALGQWLNPESARHMIAMLGMIAAARAAGAIDTLPIPQEQKEFATKADLVVTRRYYEAIPAWPLIEPENLRCRTLLYAGAANPVALNTLRAYEARLAANGARSLILENLDHKGEFDSIERVLPSCRAFLLGT
jgi:pimeloyl-ACP methyl ester carboxylesterase